MATGRDTRLTDVIIARLASVITAANMKTIAEAHLGLTQETIVTLNHAWRDNILGFNRNILRTWRIRNAGPDQVQVNCLSVTFIPIECESIDSYFHWSKFS